MSAPHVKEPRRPVYPIDVAEYVAMTSDSGIASRLAVLWTPGAMPTDRVAVVDWLRKAGVPENFIPDGGQPKE